MSDRQVVVVVGCAPGLSLTCPTCAQACGRHDHRTRQWRHLDTCQLRTVLEAEVPRVNCSEHGVQQVAVPWSEPGGRFTALFEAMVIAWLGEAPIKAVADLMDLSWDQVDWIQQRTIERGLARRKPAVVANLGIDESSYQKHHEYVITDRDRRVVLEVLGDRKKETVLAWLDTLSDQQKLAIQTVSMDMWEAFINAFLERIPEADRKICFDRFHIASYFGKAVDAVRIDEHKDLRESGSDILTHTKHQWLRNSERTDNRSRVWFMALTRASLKTARAWAIKEQAGKLWQFTSRIWAEKGWLRLITWMDRSRLAPVKKLAATIKGHLWGIINAVVTASTNAIGESLNARIQKFTAMACGFRNRTVDSTSWPLAQATRPTRNPEASIYSDRGCQYTSQIFRDRVCLVGTGPCQGAESSLKGHSQLKSIRASTALQWLNFTCVYNFFPASNQTAVISFQ